MSYHPYKILLNFKEQIMQCIVRLLFNFKLGFSVTKEARKNIERIKSYTMLSRHRLVTLYQQIVICEDKKIKGSFVECGVWRGGAVGLMALANLRHNKIRRHLHLFDSFDDICAPNEEKDGALALQEVKTVMKGKDTLPQSTRQPLKGFYDSFGGYGKLEDVQNLLEKLIGYDSSYIHYHRGWFQDTLPKDSQKIGEIAVLRLDGDWYDSIKVCLENLYPYVIKGGTIIIDDYGYYEGCTKAVDEYRASNQIIERLHYIDSGCQYWIKE